MQPKCRDLLLNAQRVQNADINRLLCNLLGFLFYFAELNGIFYRFEIDSG